MRKIILLLATVAFAATAWAQETPKKPSFAGFVTNGFWDNWELSLGAGVGTNVTRHKNLGSLENRIGFEGNISATKWFHPVIGARLQFQGGKFINYDWNAGKMKWPYVFVHSDFMLNFSNWAGGYRADRAYYAVPFVGFGYFASNFTDKAHEDNMSGTKQTIAFAYGLLNKFRISNSFDFNIELKGILTPTRVTPAEPKYSSYLFGFSATAGFSYRFNQRGWQRGMSYSAADIQAMQDAAAASLATAAALEAENAKLAKQLAAAKAEAAAQAEAAAKARAAANANKGVQAAPETSVVFFDYSMSTLTPQEKTRLDLVAESIKAGSNDTVYDIVGHADQQTGSKAGNARVAEGRAKTVYNYLVSKGVNEKQLNYVGKGNEADPFKNVQAANRAAIIK